MIHVAVLMKRYLELVLAGRKTVECRLTRDARAPFEMIEAGDRVYFKQSSGPYGATALADHVMCEGDLTGRRIKEIERDYNEWICGEGSFWRAKGGSRFCTLIWLKEVEPTATGPAVRPLQGVAWIALEEEPAWRRGESEGSSFQIEITGGNARNGTLYVTEVVDRFPAAAIGGARKAEAGTPITLMLHGGPTVETDIVGARKLLRTRVWRRWFARHGAGEGDRVVFTPVDERTFFVGLVRREGGRG